MKGSAQSQACGKNSAGSINIILNEVISIFTVCFWKTWVNFGSPHGFLVDRSRQTLKNKSCVLNK